MARLPGIVVACAGRWSLEVSEPFEPLSYNWVAPATRNDGVPVVLKVGFPCRELRSEIEALRVYDGRGIARLLAFDADYGALLLERLQPGTMLDSVRDETEATTIAVGVMRQLWRPAPPDHHFPTVADWGEGLKQLHAKSAEEPGPFPADMLAEAEETFAALLATSAEPVVLHGDLHHFNILSAEREPWLAIDPKGVVGEREYEIGAYLRNTRAQIVAEPDARAVLSRRLDIFSEVLGMDRQRLRGWAFSQALLSTGWHFENHGVVSEFGLAVTGLLRRA
ncbi:MAG: aminoglycoside phosphotransferase family protein [Tepidiformaceae bacterium]